MKTLTMRKIIAAIKKAKKQDEIPWGVGSFYNSANYNHPLRLEGSSCAVGLALRGLGYKAPNSSLEMETFFHKGWTLADRIYDSTKIDITRINDTSESYLTMIEKLELEAQSKLDTAFEWKD